MSSSNFVIHINHESEIPKYQQLIDCITNAIAKNNLKKGDALPSVNSICTTNNLSRDTVFKAYSILKEQRFIDSVPNKGYYVAGETRKVLLILDTLKAYKEVLYHSFINNLSENIITDVQFHHYNIDNFKNIIYNSIGKYYKYVVMNFDNKEIASVLSNISHEKLLLIDWNINAKAKNNYVFQDFGKAFYESLTSAINLLRKYQEVVFIYPMFTNHPIETVTFFEKFCKDFKLNYKVIKNHKNFSIEKNKAYISVSDRMLGVVLEQCKEKGFEPGNDIGILSYNDTPMKKFIYKGISVITTDFAELGRKGAEFVTSEKSVRHYVPTTFISRESL
jgi:DNA-binding transcriptional regulator YhcF (GntR family)